MLWYGGMVVWYGILWYGVVWHVVWGGEMTMKAQHQTRFRPFGETRGSLGTGGKIVSGIDLS